MWFFLFKNWLWCHKSDVESKLVIVKGRDSMQHIDYAGRDNNELLFKKFISKTIK
jgi:hypothetical protein